MRYPKESTVRNQNPKFVTYDQVSAAVSALGLSPRSTYQIRVKGGKVKALVAVLDDNGQKVLGDDGSFIKEWIEIPIGESDPPNDRSLDDALSDSMRRAIDVLADFLAETKGKVAQ